MFKINDDNDNNKANNQSITMISITSAKEIIFITKK